MSLRKRLVDVTFQRGQDEGVSEKLLPNGLFAKVHNAQWDKSGDLRTSDAHDDGPSATSGSLLGLAADGKALVTVCSDGIKRSFADASIGSGVGGFLDIDPIRPLGAPRVHVPAVGSPGGNTTQDYYLAPNGIHVVAVRYGDTRLNDIVFYGADFRVVGRFKFGSGPEPVRLDGHGSYVYALRDGDVRAYDIGSVGSTGTGVIDDGVVASLANTGGASFCVVPSDGGTEVYGVVTYNSGSGVGIERIGLVDGAVSAVTSVGNEPAGDTSCCRERGRYTAHIAWSWGANVYFARYNPATNVATLGSSVANKDGDVYIGTDTSDGGADGEAVAVVAYTDSVGGIPRPSLRAFVDADGPVTALTDIVHGFYHASHPFGMNGRWYVFAVPEEDLKTSVLLDLSTSARVVARVSPGSASRLGVPRVGYSDGVFTALAERYTGESSVVSIVSVPDTAGLPVEAGSTAHMSGGVPVQVGDDANPHGFTAPPAFSTSFPAGAGALTGSYIYAVTAVRRDRNGDEWESQPRLATVAPVAQNVTLSIVVPTVERASSVRVYRTRASEATLRLVEEIDTEYAVTLTASYTDSTTDANIGSSRLLYTTGGVLENDPPPGLGHVAVHNYRMFGVDGRRLWWSKSKVYGEGWSWSWAQYREFSSELTALASLDDVLVIWSESDCWALSGDGPARNGAGDFSVRNLADVGCVSPRSVVVTPDAIYWQSRRGMEAMARDLFPRYVGGPVQDSLSTVTAALHDPERQVVTFYMPLKTPVNGANACSVAYDYGEGQWVTESQNASAAVIVDGVPWLVVEPESPGKWATGSPIKRVAGERIESTLVVTGRVNLGRAVNGFGRIYSTTFMVTLPTSGIATFRVSTNYSDSINDVVDDQRTWVLDTSVVGTGSRRLRFSHKRQRSDGFSLRLEMFGAPMSVQSMTFEVGSSGGPTRVRTSGRK